MEEYWTNPSSSILYLSTPWLYIYIYLFIYIYIYLYSTQAWFLNSDLNTFVDISGSLDGESSCEKEAGNW